MNANEVTRGPDGTLGIDNIVGTPVLSRTSSNIPGRTENIIRMNMPKVQEEFEIICKLSALKAKNDVKARMNTIRQFIETNATLREVITRHDRNWKLLSSEVLWGNRAIFPVIEEITTYHTSSDRPNMREGFDQDYFRLLNYIKQLHEEILPTEQGNAQYIGDIRLRRTR